MPERAALVAAIEADPDSDLPRLVWADWLDDHGEPERAAVIRVQCELARSPSAKLRGRERAALNALEQVWPADLSKRWVFTNELGGGLRRHFRRGCLHRLEFYTFRQGFGRKIKPFIGREPLLDLELLVHGSTDPRRLSADSRLKLVRSLSGGGVRGKLLASPHLTNLREVWNCGPSNLRTLQTAPAGSHLHILSVDLWPFLEAGTATETARLLANNPRFISLRELFISTDQVWDEAVVLLIASPHLSPELRLSWCGDWKPPRRLIRSLKARFPGPPAVR